MFRILTVLLLLVSSFAYADLKLTVFDCGQLRFDDVSAFGLSNEETTVRELFVPCYLIQHNEHLMVWDAGLPLADVGRTDGNSRYEESFLDQLASMGVAPSDVDLVAFSHMHYDHVVPPMPSSTLPYLFKKPRPSPHLSTLKTILCFEKRSIVS